MKSISRCSIVVSIPACHAGDPGSIPGNGVVFVFIRFIFDFPPIFAASFLPNPPSSILLFRVYNLCLCFFDVWKRWTFVVVGYHQWKSLFTGGAIQGPFSLYLLPLAIALWAFKIVLLILLLLLLPFRRSPKRRRRKIHLGWSLASAILAKSTLPLAIMSVSHTIHTLSIFSFSNWYYYNLFWSFIFQVGFEMVDAIAEAEGISMSSVSFKALFGKG